MSAEAGSAAPSRLLSDRAGPEKAAEADPLPAYMELVRRRLQSAVQTPVEARRLRLGGSVIVRFHIDAAGGVSGVQVTKASGLEFLNQAALEAVGRAAPFPPPPRPAAVDAPITFVIR